MTISTIFFRKPVQPVLLLLIAVLAQPLGAIEVPYLSGRVNDYANLLDDSVEQGIEAELAQLEQETGAQLVVLTVSSLEGDPLEDFSVRVAKAWELGRGDVDDGVLLLIAHQDRKVRIEVGYGLEGTLTDLHSKRIISNVLVPHFKSGDFNGGVAAAVDVLAGTIRGQEDLIPPDLSGQNDFAGMPTGEKVSFMLVFAGVIGFFSLVALTSPGAPGWFLYVFLMPFYFVFPAATLGLRVGGLAVLSWFLLCPVLRWWLAKTGYAKKLISSGGHGGWQWSGGGWSSGGGHSRGGWSSGGGGFGGFSGGGGSFGGGGASGSW